MLPTREGVGLRFPSECERPLPAALRAALDQTAASLFPDPEGALEGISVSSTTEPCEERGGSH
jgi:hypothetical protein